MKEILRGVAGQAATGKLQIYCESQLHLDPSELRRRFDGRLDQRWRADHLQPSCSQLQPISITCAFSASSQYSPQYLLSDSQGQSQAGCAHFFVSPLSAMTVLPFAAG
jgi:hypothetical protein